MKKLNAYARLLFTAFVMVAGSALNECRAQATDYKAYSLFVYNFMKYIEWPEAQSKGDFILAVLGDSPISKELETLASTKKLKGRTIVLKKCSTPEEAGGAHLLYVSSSKSAAVKTLKNSNPVLIVGEREGLAKKGASLSFVTLEDDELKFDINKKEIEQRQLKISSQLINLGIVIN